MKSTKGYYTYLKIQLPEKEWLLEVDENIQDNFPDSEIISTQLLTSEENLTGRRLKNYKAGKYKYVKFRSWQKLKIEGSQETVAGFKDRIKDFLISKHENNSELNSLKLEKQVEEILLLLVTYNLGKVKRKYREDTRKANIAFYPEFNAFIKASNTVYDINGIRISFGKNKCAEFNLPAPKGNQHLISAMTKFFLHYYTENSPVKQLFPFTEELVFENYLQVKQGHIKHDKELIDRFHYSFHVSLLYLIRTFPQFRQSQRSGEYNLTEAEGRFIANFLNLINYDHWISNSYKFISPKSSVLSPKTLQGQIGTLRYQLKKYVSLYKNQGNSTSSSREKFSVF